MLEAAFSSISRSISFHDRAVRLSSATARRASSCACTRNRAENRGLKRGDEPSVHDFPHIPRPPKKGRWLSWLATKIRARCRELRPLGTDPPPAPSSPQADLGRFAWPSFPWPCTIRSSAY